MKKHHNTSYATNRWLKRIAWILLALFSVLIAVMIGFWLGNNQVSDDLEKAREHNKWLLEKMEKTAKKELNVSEIQEPSVPKAKKIVKEEKVVEKDEEKKEQNLTKEKVVVEKKEEVLKAQHEYAPKDKKATPPPSFIRETKNAGSDAKLVIIIDDVSYERDIKAIKSTGLPLEMSFLPPSPRHASSAKLAQQESHYMVHLPLEALDFDDEEPQTLRSQTSEEEIEMRIQALKKLYPNARYYNNHTGSKFTSDSEAMEKLIAVLKKENIQFVDSRTTGKTKVQEASRNNGVRYMGRDVFLDHQDGVNNVKKQIREAVAKAKRHGTAIAIGHPRADTIEALKQSKDILSEVKLVGIDKI